MNPSLFNALTVLICSSLCLFVNAEESVNQKKFVIAQDSIKDLIESRSGAFATDQIMIDGKKIGYMYREASDNPNDSGWRFFAGNETQEYIDDSSHTGIYTLNTVANYDQDIIPYLNTPAPCAYEKISGTNKYREVEE